MLVFLFEELDIVVPVEEKEKKEKNQINFLKNSFPYCDGQAGYYSERFLYIPLKKE